MIKTIFILWSVLFSCTVVGQTYSYFNKVCGEMDFQYCTFSGVLTVEDGFITFGHYADSIEISTLNLSKFDNNGEIIGRSNICPEDTVLSFFINRDFIETSEGNIIAAASIYKQETPNDIDTRIIKMTKEGEVLWKKDYGSSIQETLRNLIETPDGGYMTVGAIQNLEPVGFARMYILKIDGNGVLEWEQSFGYENELANAIAFSVLPTPDGGYLVGGGLQDLEATNKMLIIKIDGSGNFMWEKIIEARCYIGIYDLPDGYLLSTCQYIDNTRHTYLIKTDTALNTIWEQTYQPVNFPTNLFVDPIIRSDGSFIASVNYRNENNGIQPLIIDFDSLGNINWTKTYTLDSFGTCGFLDVKPTDDGGYIWSGVQNAPTQKGWLLKTDCQGNTCSTIGCDSVYVHTDTSVEPLCMPLPEPFVCNAQIQEFEMLLDSVNIMDMGSYTLPIFNDSLLTENYQNFYLIESSEGIGLSQDSIFEFSEMDTVRFWALSASQGDIWELESLINAGGDAGLTVSQIQDFVADNELCVAISQNPFILIIQDLDNGIIKPDWVESFGVSPNPAKENIVIDYQFNTNIAPNFVLYQLNGTVVDNIKLPINAQSMTIPIADLSSGIYLFAVQIEGNVAVRGKIVVNH